MGVATVEIMPMRRRHHLTARQQTVSMLAVDAALVALVAFTGFFGVTGFEYFGLVMLFVVLIALEFLS